MLGEEREHLLLRRRLRRASSAARGRPVPSGRGSTCSTRPSRRAPRRSGARRAPAPRRRSRARESVTTIATSMMRSRSGSSPVISMSIQARRFASCGMYLICRHGSDQNLSLSHSDPRRSRMNAFTLAFLAALAARDRDAALARHAPHPARDGASRARAARVCRRASRSPPTRRPPTTPAPGRGSASSTPSCRRRCCSRSRSAAACEWLFDAWARAFEAGRLRARHRADPRGRGDQRARRPAVLDLPHLRDRGAVRLQPDDAGALRRRSREEHRARARARRAAPLRRAVADGADGRALVALRLARPGSASTC